MKISPDILSRHLHEAAAEQVHLSMSQDGYEVERGASIGSGPDHVRADLLARRDGQALVVAVKVVGDGRLSGLGRISEAAKAMGAGFRVVLVNPQRVMDISMDDARTVVLDNLRMGSGTSKPPGDLQDVDGVEFDTVRLRPDGTELSGSAVAYVRASQDERGNAPSAALPVRFTISLGMDRRMAGPPLATYDLDDWDGPDA